VISRIASGEYRNISFIHEIADSSVDDVTAEILAEAALPVLPETAVDLQARRFDPAHNLRKHETAWREPISASLENALILTPCRETPLPSRAAS